MSETPVAKIIRITTCKYKPDVGQRTIHVSCPYCGKEHQHGGGKENTPIEQYFGYRASHCLKETENNNGYRIER